MPNNRPKTRLEILMKSTNVSGKDLSTTLHVDMSLISRWKNGKRSLGNNPEHLKNICHFFTNGDQKAYEEIVSALLYGDNLSIDDKEQHKTMEDDLSVWLLEPMKDHEHFRIQKQQQPTSSSNNTYYLTFEGNEGRRQGVMACLETALAQKNPCEIFTMDTENDQWLWESNPFYIAWKQKLNQLIDKGHKITMVRSIDKPVHTIFAEMMEWIPFYLAGNINAFIHPKVEEPLGQRFYMIVEETNVLSGFFGGCEERFTAFTNDAITIQSYQGLINSIIMQCKPLFKLYDQHTFNNVINAIVSYGEYYDNSYYMANELFFTNMSESLLEEVLTDNNCNAHEVESVLNFHKLLTGNFKKNVHVFKNYHIYNYKSLELCANKEHYINKHLSIITKRTIKMKPKQFISHIQGVIDRLQENSGFNVILTERSRNEELYEDLDMWIKDGHFVCVWSNNTFEKLLISMEPSVTQGFTEFYERIMLKFSDVEKNKEKVLAKFYKLKLLAESHIKNEE